MRPSEPSKPSKPSGPFWHLAALEFGSYRRATPGLRGKQLFATIGYFASIVMAGLYFFPPNEAVPHEMFPLALSLLCGAIGMFGIFTIVGAATRPLHEWWLLIPHSRMLLMAAKAYAIIRFAWPVSIVLVAACSAHYAISVRSLGLQVQAMDMVWLAGSNLLFAWAAVPVFVVLGMFISVFNGKWMKFVLMPYLIVMQAPFIAMGILRHLDERLAHYISPASMLLYAGAMLVGGWALSYGLFQWIASRGMANLADARMHIGKGDGRVNPGMRTGSSQQALLDRRQGQDGGGTKAGGVSKAGLGSKAGGGARAIYDLERSRYRYYGKHPFLRSFRYLIYLAVAVGAFFSSAHPGSGLELLEILYMLPVLGFSLWMLLRMASDRPQLEWWLAFPYRRNILVMGRLAAVWATALRIIGSLSASFWLGALTALAAGYAAEGEVARYIPWFFYSLFIYVVALIMSTSVAQAVHCIQYAKGVALLSIPLSLYVSFQALIIRHFMYPEPFGSGEAYQLPNFMLAGILGAAALLIAFVAVRIAGRHLHLIIAQPLRPSGESKG